MFESRRADAAEGYPIHLFQKFWGSKTLLQKGLGGVQGQRPAKQTIRTLKLRRQRCSSLRGEVISNRLPTFSLRVERPKRKVAQRAALQKEGAVEEFRPLRGDKGAAL